MSHIRLVATMVKRALLIVLLVIILAPIAPAHAAPLGWMITPVYAPIGYAPIVDEYHQIGNGVYHLEGTTWIGDGWGRVVLAGHNPGIFAPLEGVGVESLIILLIDGETRTYEVTERIITTDNRRYLAPTKTPTLTLITCMDRGKTWLILNAQEVN